jgi:hypothetical protein
MLQTIVLVGLPANFGDTTYTDLIILVPPNVSGTRLSRLVLARFVGFGAK